MLSCALNDGGRREKIYVGRGRGRDIQIAGEVAELGAGKVDGSSRGRYMNKASDSHRQGWEK